MIDHMNAEFGRLALGGGLPTDGERTRVVRPPAVGGRSQASMGEQLRGAIVRADDGALLRLVAQARVVDLNSTFGPQRTPLLVEVAATVENPARLEWLMRLLIDHGANPSARDALDMDALMTLLRRSDRFVDATTLVLRRRPDVQRTNARGETPLHLLLQVWRRHQPVVLQMLLNLKVDLFKPTPEGIFPLWLAARSHEAPPLVAAMLQACPPQLRADMARAESHDLGRELGHAGTAALLYQPDDDATETILMLLASCGLSLRHAEAQACALEQVNTVGRSYQDYMARCTGAAQGMRLGPEAFGARPSQAPEPVVSRPPKPPAARAPEPPPPRSDASSPTTEAARPRALARPLPRPPVRSAPSAAPPATAVQTKASPSAQARPLEPAKGEVGQGATPLKKLRCPGRR